MFTTLLTLSLLASPATLPPQPPASALVDDDDRHGGKHRDKEERKEWKHRDREERDEDEYWKHERKWEKHRFHDHEDDRDWDFDHPRHRHPTPPWMNSWWRPDERHYCAVDPRDPSRVFVFMGGRWVQRRVYDPRFRADITGAFDLPIAPPPVPLPPNLGIDLHVVLFN